MGAAIAGNCLPCLHYHFDEALKVRCSLVEITEAIELAKLVKGRPIHDINKMVDDLLKREREKI